MIASILDTDLYKLTMQQAVLDTAADARVVYSFTNRAPEAAAVSQAMFDGIRQDIDRLATLKLTRSEYEWLRQTCSFFKPQYLEYLANYRFDPNEIKIELSHGELSLEMEGLWHRTILWEVPLLALISRNHFLHVEAGWSDDGQDAKAHRKARLLSRAGCQWADFGERRRRNFASQNRIVSIHKNYRGFVGTSNVYLAFCHQVRPIGTMAHEWIMAASALYSLRHANQYALEKWVEVYKGNLGIALTDTFGTEAFLADFGQVLAREFDGVRHDSDDPFAFTDHVIAHYESLRIDPLTKTIVFSDALSPDMAVQLNQYCHDKIRCSFGIGTNFTNDYDGSPPLNIVIKLCSINGIPVVKLSDVGGKATGDSDALKVANWTFFGHLEWPDEPQCHRRSRRNR